MIQTKRMLLRPWADADLEYLINLYTDKEVMKYYVGAPYNKLIATTCFTHFQNHQAKHGFSCWAVEHTATNQWIGQCGIRILKPWNEVSLSYIFHPNFWGKGLATEAAMAVVNAGFQQYGLHEIIAWIMEGHKGSHNVAAKLGMSLKREEYYKKVLFQVMSLTRNNWTKQPYAHS